MSGRVRYVSVNGIRRLPADVSPDTYVEFFCFK